MAQEALECPYPPIGPDCSVNPRDKVCPCRRKPVVLCPACSTANRVLSRICRHCGQAFEAFNWQSRGGEHSSLALTSRLKFQARPDSWTARLDHPISCAPLVVSGLLVGLSREGSVSIFEEGSSLPLFHGRLPGLENVVASPVALDGLLLVAVTGKLVVADLVDLLEISPGANPRRGVLPLKGELCSHLACDGSAYAAAATRHDERLLITVFRNRQAATVDHLWTRTPTAEAVSQAALAFVDHHLMVATPEGQIWCYALESGQLVGEDHIEQGLAPATILGRGPFALVSSSDGTLYQVYPRRGLVRTAVAQPVGEAPFAIGASHQLLLACHGKTLRKIDLRSGKSQQLEVPLYCTSEPIVAAQEAVLLSNDGTLYQVNLAGNDFDVAFSQRLFATEGSLPAPPVVGPSRVFAAGPQGEVVAVERELN